MPGLLMDAKEAMLAGLHDRLAAAGYPEIREAHGCIFRHLHDGGLRISEIAEREGMTKQAIGEHVDRLAAFGFVERVPDPADGRAKIVRPTEKGEAALAIGRQAFEEIEAEWGRALGEERIAELRETLEAIRALQSS
jgi:DNA-binding MarR family transcriptional regulator